MCPLIAFITSVYLTEKWPSSFMYECHWLIKVLLQCSVQQSKHLWALPYKTSESDVKALVLWVSVQEHTKTNWAVTAAPEIGVSFWGLLSDHYEFSWKTYPGPGLGLLYVRFCLVSLNVLDCHSIRYIHVIFRVVTYGRVINVKVFCIFLFVKFSYHYMYYIVSYLSRFQITEMIIVIYYSVWLFHFITLYKTV